MDNTGVLENPNLERTILGAGEEDTICFRQFGKCIPKEELYNFAWYLMAAPIGRSAVRINISWGSRNGVLYRDQMAMSHRRFDALCAEFEGDIAPVFISNQLALKRYVIPMINFLHPLIIFSLMVEKNNAWTMEALEPYTASFVSEHYPSGDVIAALKLVKGNGGVTTNVARSNHDVDECMDFLSNSRLGL